MAISRADATTDVDRGRAATTPSEITARGWRDVAQRVRRELADDHISLAAAGVAFFGFLAVIPALAAVVSIAGLVTSPEEAASTADDLFASLPSEAQELLAAQLESVAGRADSALSISLVVSILLALWSASSGMGHLLDAVNVAYGEHDDRGFVRKRAMALAFTFAAVVFVLFALGGLVALPAVLDAVDLPGWLQIVYWPILLAGFVCGLAVLYRHAPDRAEPRWRWVSWGAVIAVGVWLLASVGFRIYATGFASYDESYGSLAAVVVLLLWLQITAFAVLLGAEINAELEHQTARDSTTGPERRMGARGAVMADTLGESS